MASENKASNSMKLMKQPTQSQSGAGVLPSKGKTILISNNNNNNNIKKKIIQNNNPSSRKVIENNPSSNKKIVDLKHKSISTITKPELKGKTISSSSSKTISSSSSKTVTKTTTVRVKSVKRVYTLPGQKFDPPEEREPLRIFYESLSKQIPSSEMAEFWMMEHGLLSPQRAKKAFARKQKRQQQLKMGTPIKSRIPDKPESSQKPQAASKNGDVNAKKRIMSRSNDDNDFIVKLKKSKG